jgi:hypothetical protein
MNYDAIAIAIFGLSMVLIGLISPISTHLVFAGGYKSQVISQVNECGNYWFPVNIICSNLNSQTQGEENNVAIATTPESGSADSNSNTNYGTPFP